MSLQPHGLQYARLLCFSSHRVCSNSYSLSQWCHITISSSFVPFSSCLQSFPASGSFPMSQFFTSGGQTIGVLALHSKKVAAAKSLQSCPTLCDPRDGSPPGSPIPGILQARTLEWVAISFSKCMKVKSESEVAQSCPTLRNPMDCSPPGSSAHGIFQARVLEWGAIAFSGVWSYSPV